MSHSLAGSKGDRSIMLVPTFDQFIYPLLQVLAAAPEGLRAADAHDRVADWLGLSPEARAETLTGGQHVYRNRIGWAHDRLKRAGLSSCPKRGVWQITPKGRDFLASHANGIDEETLRELASVRPQGGEAAGAQDEEGGVLVRNASPEDLIQAAIDQHHESLRIELLELIKNNSPEFFERLVLDLLYAMGYGGSRENLYRVGGTGDGGIDGVISLDRLGLEKVYVQAKRWQSPVGQPEVQNFKGALAVRDTKKGVFITTSDFTPSARHFAEKAGITLISGDQLAALMIEYGVGVTVYNTIKLCRVDGDYFDQG